MNNENVSLTRTYNGKDRHDFLTEVVDIVMRFDWKAEGIDPEDARSHLYLEMINWLNTRHDLHDGEKEHFQAKGISIIQGRVIRGNFVASFKSNGHDKPDNKTAKKMLQESKPSEILDAYNELGQNYREVIEAVVVNGEPNPRDRKYLNKALTSLSNKVDLKLASHIYSLDRLLENGEHSDDYDGWDDYDLDDVDEYDYLISGSLLDDDDELDLTTASWGDAVKDLYENDTFISDEFISLAYDKVVEDYGITAHLYMWMNGQECPDPDLKVAWEHLDEEERYAIYVRYTNAFTGPNTSGIIVDSKVKRRYHEESMKAQDRLEEIWEGIKSGMWVSEDILESAVELVSEMTTEPAQIHTEPLYSPEPTRVPPALQEALENVSEPLDALEDFLEIGWSDDERFLSAWSRLSDEDKFYIFKNADPGVPEMTKRRGLRARAEEATERYLHIYKTALDPVG